MVDLRAADGDWWGGLGRDAVAQASHVALGGSDLEVIAGVWLKVWDDGFPHTGVYLHLLPVVLHLEDRRSKFKQKVKCWYADDRLLYFNEIKLHLR